jgi:hypothetical protein
VAYEAALRDPQLRAFDRDLALLESRIEALLPRLDTGESKSLWSDLRVTHSRIVDCGKREDASGLVLAIGQLGELVERANRVESAWSDLLGTLDVRRKISETDTRARALARATIPAEEAMALLVLVLETVRDLVSVVPSGRDILVKLQERVDVIVTTAQLPSLKDLP